MVKVWFDLSLFGFRYVHATLGRLLLLREEVYAPVFAVDLHLDQLAVGAVKAFVKDLMRHFKGCLVPQHGKVLVFRQQKPVFEGLASVELTHGLLFREFDPQRLFLIAGGPVRTVLELAGLKDVVSKSLGSNTKINTSKATMRALVAQKSAEHIASLRGKSVEEIR